MKLEGSLETFPLRELIDMVVYSSVTGALNVYGPSTTGHIYFRDGTLYHAEWHAARGVDALATMTELTRALFAFVSDATSDEQSLWDTPAHDLLSAERLAQRWRQARPYVPHLDLIPRLLPARETAQRSLGPAQLPLLAALDGRKNLRELAVTLDWSEIDLVETIAQMSLDGLVELQASSGHENALAERGQRSQGGIFDRARREQPVARPADPNQANGDGGRSGGEELILRLLRS